MIPTELARHADQIARALLGQPNKALSTEAQLRYGTTAASPWRSPATKPGPGTTTSMRQAAGCST